MTKKIFTTLGLLLLLVLPARAAEQGGIELKATAEVDITVTNDQGVKVVSRVPAAEANIVPGDTIIFTTYYEYQGTEPATNVVINNPLPEHMLYLEGSAEGAGTRSEFSIDYGKNFAQPDQLIVKTTDGFERLARVAEYTHVRWTILGELGPGAKGFVSYKAKVK